MKRYLLFVFMMLVGGYASAQNLKTKAIDNMMNQTVSLMVYYHDAEDENTYTGNCAGVWVGQNHVLTAAHCVEDIQFFEIERNHYISTIRSAVFVDSLDNSKNSGYIGKMDRIAVDAKCDLAVLAITEALKPRGEHPIASIRESELEIGEKVQTIGHPGKFYWVYTSGEVSAINVNGGDHDIFNLMNLNMGHGNSGGGLFDSDGKLIGITRAISISGDVRLSVYATQNCMNYILKEAKDTEAKNKKLW